ncbi:hypothetical protein NUW54_g9885 [Trametes sanguinea]|uniref:Uncharacterized protein n=1 Tax=Trametes sanguinea TaxID=158606 RepID=A0ACC1P2X2_9APHY|nr:hypothetical protein NUW54_g9885 [Trametes sanguinea]
MHFATAHFRRTFGLIDKVAYLRKPDQVEHIKSRLSCRHPTIASHLSSFSYIPLSLFKPLSSGKIVMTVIPPSFVTIKTVHGVEVVENRVSLVDALSLELQAIHVSSLSFSPIHPTEFYLLLPPLTSRRMPFLEELEIVVQQPSDPKAPYLTVPAMTLPPSNFLLLETLRLDGVTLSMSAPFLSSLRHLVLANYPSVEQCTRFIDLMAALESCPNLEELEMRNYGRVFSLAGDDEPQTRAMLNQLKKFTVDEPTFVARLQTRAGRPSRGIGIHLSRHPTRT